MDTDKARETAREILKRAQNDPAFKQQLANDPQGTLTAAGLPENTVNDFLREAIQAGAIESDVAGYVYEDPIPTHCTWTCVLTTIDR